MGWEVGGRFEREGTCAYRWLIHVDLRQKPTQHGKAIILQFKINKFFKKEGQTNKKREVLPCPLDLKIPELSGKYRSLFCWKSQNLSSSLSSAP